MGQTALQANGKSASSSPPCGGCFSWLASQHGGAAKTFAPGSPAVIVVDPYSSGRFLLYELQPRGVPIICVRSSLKLGSFFLQAYEKNKGYFAATVDYSSLEQAMKDIQALQWDVKAVFAGSEPGVETADLLAEALGLEARNSTALTQARKDKAAMQERLRECGVPAAEQLRSGNLPELLAWAKNRDRWPLVAKPTGSSGSDGIFFCQGPEDITMAHEELIGKMNPNGILNLELVLQEFLDGTEYIVDTVSHEGKHLCCAVWAYTKRKGTPWNPHCIVSEGNRLLPPSGEKQDLLIDYTLKVLDAVGLRYGPCHTEIMLTARGPILVEVNARLHGLQGPSLIGMATGTSKAAYAVDALLDGGRQIQQRTAAAAPSRFLYPLQKHCYQIVLISPTQGYLKVAISKSIEKLKLSSLVEVLPSVQQGQWLNQTCDLNTAAGYVLLVHPSSQQIDKDAERLRAAEASGELYQVSLSPLPSTPVASPGLDRQRSRSPPPSPRLQSSEKAEEVWAAEDQGLPGGDASELKLSGF